MIKHTKMSEILNPNIRFPRELRHAVDNIRRLVGPGFTGARRGESVDMFIKKLTVEQLRGKGIIQ